MRGTGKGGGGGKRQEKKKGRAMEVGQGRGEKEGGLKGRLGRDREGPPLKGTAYAQAQV